LDVLTRPKHFSVIGHLELRTEANQEQGMRDTVREAA
jgi:hypothetical protein